MDSGFDTYRDTATEAWSFGVGLTPILPIKVNDSVTIYAKLEGFNRFKSIKDRAAFFMINTALKNGVLDKSKTLIEASSGNTGIAIASIATALGFKAEIYVPGASSIETRETLKKTGAEITEVEDEYSRSGRINIDSAVAIVHGKIAADPDKYVNLDQYRNVSNTYGHVYTTGPEIMSALGSLEVSPQNFVAGIGTGGTITGFGTFNRKYDLNCTVYGAEPVPGHHIQGLKNLTVSKTPEILEARMDLIDKWVSIDDEMAYEGVRRLTEYGYFAGISSGANYMAALKIASEIKHGNIVTIFPDSAEKYRSVLTSHEIFTENEFDRLAGDFLSVPENAIRISKDQMVNGV